MNRQEIWAGLGGSAFLADVDNHDREPWRVAAVLIGGLGVGAAAAIASYILVMTPYILIMDPGGGWGAFARITQRLRDPTLDSPGMNLLRQALTAPSDGLFLLAFVIFAARIDGHRFSAYIGIPGRRPGRLLLLGLTLSAVALIPLISGDAVRAMARGTIPILNASTSLADRSVYGLAALILIPSAALEELFFRGWLLRQTAAFSRHPAVLILFPAFVFAALHFEASGDAFLMRTLMGIGLAYMTLRTGGIELSAGAHAMNNILFVLLIAPAGGVDGSASALPPLLRDGLILAGYFAMTEAVMRMRPLRRWAGLS